MTSPPMELLVRLQKFGQAHVLTGWDALDMIGRARLESQLAGIDFAQLETLRGQSTKVPEAIPANIEPVPITAAAFTAEEKARGEEALRRGEDAALLVAGG